VDLTGTTNTSERNRVSGRADEAVPEGDRCRGGVDHGPGSVRTSKARAFWARVKAERNQPGACSRCGRPNDLPPTQRGARGLCSRCRAYLARRRAARDAQRARDLTEQTEAGRALARRVAVLELRVERFAKILRAQYKAGYQVGMNAERRRWRDMPRDWDSWRQEVGVEEGKKHFHRLAAAAEASEQA